MYTFTHTYMIDKVYTKLQYWIFWGEIIDNYHFLLVCIFYSKKEAFFSYRENIYFSFKEKLFGS